MRALATYSPWMTQGIPKGTPPKPAERPLLDHIPGVLSPSHTACLTPIPITPSASSPRSQSSRPPKARLMSNHHTVPGHCFSVWVRAPLDSLLKALLAAPSASPESRHPPPHPHHPHPSSCQDLHFHTLFPLARCALASLVFQFAKAVL